MLVQDLGGTGSGGLEATNSFNVTVNPVNDAPVHLFNGSNAHLVQTTNEDTNLTFNAANGNAITITDDSDEGDTELTTTVTVDSGNPTSGADTGVSLEFEGTLPSSTQLLMGLDLTQMKISTAR